MKLFILVWKCFKIKMSKKLQLFFELILPVLLMLVFLIVRPRMPIETLPEGFGHPMAMPSNGMMLTAYSILCNDVVPKSNISSLYNNNYINSRFKKIVEIIDICRNNTQFQSVLDSIMNSLDAFVISLKKLSPSNNYIIRVKDIVTMDSYAIKQLSDLLDINETMLQNFIDETYLDKIAYNESPDELYHVNKEEFFMLFPNGNIEVTDKLFNDLHLLKMSQIITKLLVLMYNNHIIVNEIFIEFVKSMNFLGNTLKTLKQDPQFSDINDKISELNLNKFNPNEIREFFCSSINETKITVESHSDYPFMFKKFSKKNIKTKCITGRIQKIIDSILNNKYPVAISSTKYNETIFENLNSFFKPFNSVMLYLSKKATLLEDLNCYLFKASNGQNPYLSSHNIQLVKKVLHITTTFYTNDKISWIPSGFKLVKNEQTVIDYFYNMTNTSNLKELYESSVSPLTIGISINETIKEFTYKLIYLPFLSPNTERFYPKALENLHMSQWSYKYFTNFVIYFQDIVESSLIITTFQKFTQFTNKYMATIPKFCFIYDRIVQSFCGALPFFSLIGYSLLIISAIHCLITEKESKKWDMLKIMGVSHWLHLLSWFVTFCTYSVLTIIPLALYMYVSHFITFTNPAIFSLTFFTFCASSFSYCIVISALFKQANIGAAVGYLIFFVCYIPYPIIVFFQNDVPIYLNILTSFLLPVSFSKVCLKISMWEERRVKLSLSNLFISPYSINDFGLGYYWIMMVIDGLLYLFLAILIMWLKKQSVKKSFNNCFDNLKGYLITMKRSSISHCNNEELDIMACNINNESSASISINSNILSYSCNNVVRIQRIYKRYSKKRGYILKNISFDLKKNEKTCLLGPNGAGKSTLLSIILGQTDSTSGSVYIGDTLVNKYCNFTNVGFCPQHNILYDSLTVLDHLFFYSKLKNSSNDDNFDSFLNKMDMLDKKHASVSSLSGGMKRKLSIGIAFIGNPQLVILDEPTAGVDPYSRRSIWNLISNFNKEKTILFTTHHMDEADILSDNIVFIYEGSILTIGSPFTLKQTYGGGLKITFSMMDNSTTYHSDKIIESFNNFIPDSKLVRFGKGDMAIELKKGVENMPEFIDLLEFIEFNMENLNIKACGIDAPSLEDVFVNLDRVKKYHVQNNDTPLSVLNDQHVTLNDRNNNGEHSNNENNVESNIFHHANTDDNFIFDKLVDLDKNEASNSLADNSNFEETINYAGDDINDLKFIFHCLRCFLVIWHIKFIRFLRDYRAAVCKLVVPIIFIIISTCIVMSLSESDGEPILAMNLNSMSKHIPQTIVVGQQYSYNKSSRHPLLDILERYTKVKDKIIYPKVNYCLAQHQHKYSCPKDQILNHELHKDNYTRYTMKKPFINCKFVWIDSCPYQAYLMDTQFDNDRKRLFSISFNNNVSHLFAQETNSTLVEYDHSLFHSSVMGLNFLNNLIYKYNCIKNEIGCENKSINGYIQKVFYNSYNSQYRLRIKIQKCIFISMFLGLGMSFSISSYSFFMVENRKCNMKHLYNVYGLTPWVYIIGNIIFDLLTFLITILFALLIFKINDIGMMIGHNTIQTILLFFLYIYAVLPQMYAFSYIFDCSSSAYIILCAYNVVLSNVGNMIINILQILQIVNEKELKYVNDFLLVVPQHTFVDTLVSIFKNDYLMQHNNQYSFLKLKIYKNFDFDYTGKRLISFAVVGTIEIIVIIIVEYYIYYSTRRNHNSNNDKNYPINGQLEENNFSQDILESDVIEESRTVNSSIIDNYSLKVCNLKKIYKENFKPNIVAVKNVSFHVKKGECFGLLGINGAGKTTTFKMLTGQTSITSGHISYGDNFNRNKLIHAPFSYCPQIDALDKFLTPIDHIKHFAILRGYSFNHLNRITNTLIQKYNLETYSKQIVAKLSMGNRRKLMVLLCEIANPTIIYYDEPTAGMDPSGRRLIWNAIQSLTKNGTSVILTSHNMDECQILCDRIAIMINGQFACIGSPQHLTNKFGSGYDIIVKINNRDLDHVIQSFSDLLPYSTLNDIHFETLYFTICPKKYNLSHIFKMLKRLTTICHIESYSISQEKLEQVFVNLLNHHQS